MLLSAVKTPTTTQKANRCRCHGPHWPTTSVRCLTGCSSVSSSDDDVEAADDFWHDDDDEVAPITEAGGKLGSHNKKVIFQAGASFASASQGEWQ